MTSKLAAALAFILFAGTCAATYPERPIRMIVPTAPGGGPDVVGRIFALRLGTILGQQIVVDNRAGANGIIGSEIAARATPDGYTLLITSTSFAINPNVYRKLPYDPLRDFTPISMIVNSGGLVIVVHPSFPARSLQQLIEIARAGPGKINYGSPGFGNLAHLAGELFQLMAGVKINHVPYKGAGPAVNDLLAGHIPLMFGASPSVVPFVKTGRLRALAFTGPKRSDQLPDVPTVDETGLKGYEASGWFGLYGPAGLAKPIVNRLYESAREAVQTPETRKRYAEIIMESVGSTPDEFTRFLKEDLVKYAKIVKAAGIEQQ